ncbi:16854_t:CDS:2 [Entrophospora sp. SA101]|nr:16854_t:CDS:2 [Entrophospora sp. SA101]
MNCLVTDSAGEYTAARKHLRKAFHEKVFLPCYAHQLNLCVGDLFKESSNFSRVSSLAIDIISTFRKSTYFMGQLHTEQDSIYRGKYVHLSLPCDTRWNSFFHSYFNLLKTKSALKSLVTKLNPEDTFIVNENEVITLPIRICNIIENDSWWCDLRELVRLLHPFCAALNKLQRDKARLDHVLYSFGKIVQMIQEIPLEEFKNQMLI